MKKNIYFHIELKQGDTYNLVGNAYKNEELQLDGTNSLKQSEYKLIGDDNHVSSELFKAVSRRVYGSPLSEKSRITLKEMGDTSNTVFVELNIMEFYNAKKSERAGVIRDRENP